ncbi:type II secretion system protein G [Streptomyces cavourensis]|nr:type II secretion system protein G [Streptomyces cavourensis]
MARCTTNGDRGRRQKGFTLIELLVVMAIIATLTAFVAPGYLKQSDRAKETVLRHNLAVVREALEGYRGDRDRDPESLEVLVQDRYLREVPLDPITGKRDSWILIPGPDGGVGDLASGAPGRGLDGRTYESW